MKHFIVFLSIIFSSFSVLAQDAKDVVTETYKVQGNCNMCKKRIEQAAFIKGVKRTEWNEESKELKVVYRPSKTNADQILASVAKAGYSSDKIEAKEEDYLKLPKCCHYKTEECNH